MPSQLIDRLRDGLDTFNRTGEVAVGFLAPEFELHQASSIVDTAGVFRGPTAFRDSLDELGESFESLSFEPERFFDAPGGEIVVLIHARGVVEAVGWRSTTTSPGYGPSAASGPFGWWSTRTPAMPSRPSDFRSSGGMPDANIEIVRRLIAAWDQRDLQAALEDMHPQCEVRGAEARETLRGHDGVAAGFRDWFEAFEEFTIEPEDFTLDGDRVLVAMRQRARGKGSGLEIEQRFYQLFTLRDGLVIRFEEYSEEAEAWKALGRPDTIE